MQFIELIIIIHNRKDVFKMILFVHVFWNEKCIYFAMYSHFISSAFRDYPNTHSGSYDD